MRYQTIDLLLLTAAIAIGLGWRSFLMQDLTFKWHERHPVMPVTRIVNGQEETTQERVLMYYAHDQFFWPKDFNWIYVKFYVPRLLQLIALSLGTIVATVISIRRWPKLLSRLLLCLLIPVGFICFLIFPLPFIVLLLFLAFIKGLRNPPPSRQSES